MNIKVEKKKALNGDKVAITSIISRIREEIGHEDIKPDIIQVISDRDKDEMLILTSDRPDKSAVIGKGGWVVGRLREELGVDQIHVEAYSDILIRKYQMKLAYRKMKEILSAFENDAQSYPSLLNLFNLLKKRMDNPYNWMDLIADLNKNKKKEEAKLRKTPDAVVALSGGVDSTFSLIVAELIGFNPIAVTVYPGDIFLPKYFQDNVEKLSHRLGVQHKYLKVDMAQVVEGALEGRFHPCGRCSKIIEKTVQRFAHESGISFLIFGDLLSTGVQSLVFNADILRINLPALLSVSKGEVKSLAGKFGVKKMGVNGCPLLGEMHKKHPYMRRYSVQRILRETRAGILEPGDALEMIISSFN